MAPLKKYRIPVSVYHEDKGQVRKASGKCKSNSDVSTSWSIARVTRARECLTSFMSWLEKTAWAARWKRGGRINE